MVAGLVSAATTGLGISSALSNSTGMSQRLMGKRDRVQFVGARGVLLQLDACTSEEHGREATITQYPVEGGGTISDHVLLAPQGLSITGIISDTPLADLKQLLTESAGVPVNAVLGPLGVVAGSAAYAMYKAMKGARSPSVAAFAQLCRMQAGNLEANPPVPPEPFDVLSSLKRYPNMLIQSLTVPRTVENGNSITFTVKLVQLTVVTPQSVPIAVFANPKLGAGKQSTGNQQLDKLRDAAKRGHATEKAEGFSKFVRGVP